jgi:transcriptional adapter 2-alpha
VKLSHAKGLTNLMACLQMQKAEKNKSKEEKDLIQRYKVFAKAQTAEDYEVLLNGLHCKHISRSQAERS